MVDGRMIQRAGWVVLGNSRGTFLYKHEKFSCDLDPKYTRIEGNQATDMDSAAQDSPRSKEGEGM